MNILYHQRTKSRDGQAVHIRALIAALRARGHRVEEWALSPGEDGAMGSEGGAAGRLLARAPRALYELAEHAYGRFAAPRLEAAGRRLGADLIYERYALGNTAGLRAARRLGIPLLLEVNSPLARERAEHETLVFRRWAAHSERRLLQQADRVLCVTRVLADLIVEAGAPRPRVAVVRNGVDLARYPDPAFRPGEAVVIGFVGFVRDWNRLERAFPFLARRDDATLLVVGEGPDRARLETLARERGVAGRVRFLGSLPRDEVLAHVAAFDVALLPEVTEYASPLKLLDYLAAGRAVLAPDRANLREVVEPDRDALLFDAAAPEAFDAALERLAASPELREKIGAAGRSTLLRHGLTWDGNAAKVVARFAELRARGSGR